MTNDEWMTLSNAADILERHGFHEESVAVFRVVQDNNAAGGR